MVAGVSARAQSLRVLGYEVEVFPDAPLALAAGCGEVELVPWEISTPHRKLRAEFREFCVRSFGWTVERREKNATTLFFRAYRPGKVTSLRIDMRDHWGRIHTFAVKGPGERAIAYSGRESFVPKYIELSNTPASELTSVSTRAAEIAADIFVVMAVQYGMRRSMSPRVK